MTEEEKKAMEKYDEEGFPVYQIIISILPDGIGIRGVRHEIIYQMLSPTVKDIVSKLARKYANVSREVQLPGMKTAVRLMDDEIEEEEDEILNAKEIE